MAAPRACFHRRAQEVLRQPPDFQEGHEPRAWAVSPAEALAISEAHYDRGLTPDEVRRLAADFPPDRFWWSIQVSYLPRPAGARLDRP